MLISVCVGALHDDSVILQATGVMHSMKRCCAGGVLRYCFAFKHTQRYFSSITEQVNQLQAYINISKEQENVALLQHRQLELQAILEKEDTWNNTQLATQLSQELSSTTLSIDYFNDVDSQVENVVELSDLATEEQDDDLLDECSTILTDLQQALKVRRLQSLMSSEQDQSGCYLEIVSGAGGADAFHWTKMLANMYCKWASKMDYLVTYIDEQHDDSAGGVGGQV